MTDIEQILLEIEKHLTECWECTPKNDFIKGRVHEAKHLSEFIKTIPIFKVGQTIVPKNHQERGLTITDIRDGRYYSCDLEICPIVEQHEWEIEKKPSDALEKAAEFVFPELKGSEDERIRKELISHFCGIRDNCGKDWYGFNINDVIAWLEKQDGHWLKSLKPNHLPVLSKDALSQAKKDAYHTALDKIEYHSGEPTFDDGWSAAIDYITKHNIVTLN